MKTKLFVLITVLLVTACSPAYAFKPYVFFGVEHQLQQTNNNVSVFCTNDGRTTSNLGAGVERQLNNNFKVTIEWTHHSCVFEEDWNIYDAGGIKVYYYF